MNRPSSEKPHLRTILSRRAFVRKGVFGTAALALAPIVRWRSVAAASASAEFGPARWVLPFNRDWLFGGRLNPSTDRKGANHRSFVPITLPHCVAKLSWQNWDPAAWQDLWAYRRLFTVPKEFRRSRVFLQFDGVMVGTTPSINGHELPRHLGGYLPFDYELTEWLKVGDNLLDVAVDSRWSNVPPEGSPQGPKRVDYLEAGGICRPVWLKAVPQIFICDVFAKPVQVLNPTRRVEVSCTIDAAAPAKGVELQVEMRDGASLVARARQFLSLERRGEN